MFWEIVGALFFFFYVLPVLVALLFTKEFWIFIGCLILIIILLVGGLIWLADTNSRKNSQSPIAESQQNIESATTRPEKSSENVSQAPMSKPGDVNEESRENEMKSVVKALPAMDEPQVNEETAIAEIPSGYFSIGSTKAAVLAVQGSPTAVMGNLWWYGASSITFESDRVSGYSNTFNGLHVILLPTSDVATVKARGYFTIGSTKDEVLAIQGTPDNVMGNLWWYGASSVTFSRGVVESYSNSFGNLKVSYR